MKLSPRHMLLIFLLGTVEVLAQETGIGTYELFSVGPLPIVVSEDQDFELAFSGYNLLPYDAGTTLVTVAGNVIQVNSLPSLCYAAGNPPLPPNTAPTVRVIPILGLPAGTYIVEGDWGQSCDEQRATIESEVIVYSNPPAPSIQHESPIQGQILSGVGVIRGWACDASLVQVQFDELPLLAIAYGTSRADTSSVCGDDNNGYGAVFAWGLLGNGAHSATTFVDGVVVSAVEFEVSGLDQPFIRGLDGSYQLPDFPVAGKAVTVRWSEADQNFIIVEYEQ